MWAICSHRLVLDTWLTQAVISLRTLLQDRIAALNGRSVEHVLKQDKRAFTRLVLLSAVQASSL